MTYFKCEAIVGYGPGKAPTLQRCGKPAKYIRKDAGFVAHVCEEHKED